MAINKLVTSKYNRHGLYVAAPPSTVSDQSIGKIASPIAAWNSNDAVMPKAALFVYRARLTVQ